MSTQPRTLYALILGMLAALGPLCTDFYLPALPDITAHLQVSTSATQLTLTASLVGLGLGQLVFGPLSDRMGRKVPLLASLIIFILASIGCAIATNMSGLMAARFIQGLAGAGGAVLSRAIARDCYSGQELTQFFALLMAINGVAPIAAPVLGGLQLAITGWQGLFVTLALVGLVMLVVVTTKLAESYPPQRRQKKQSNMVASFIAVMRDRRFMGLCLVQGFMLAGLFAYIGASSYVFQSYWQLTPQQYSYLFALNGAGLIVFSLGTVKLSGRWGEKPVLMGALVLSVLAAATLLSCGAVGAPLVAIVPVLFVAVSINSAVCTLAGAMAMQTQEQHSGTASAFLGTLMFLMGGVSAPLTGIGGTSFISMGVVLAASYLLALLSYVLIARKA